MSTYITNAKLKAAINYTNVSSFTRQCILYVDKHFAVLQICNKIVKNPMC